MQHRNKYDPIGGSPGLRARLWPNGEIAIWKPKTYQQAAVKAYDKNAPEPPILSIWRMCNCPLSWVGLVESDKGLSTHPIFDKVEGYSHTEDSAIESCRIRKGLKGITPYGARMVRNAAHVLENTYGKARCGFATVTVPNLPLHQMAVVHENWCDIVERYRLNVRRILQDKGLSGEIVSASEIQVERYKETGLPVLHLHAVFCNYDSFGRRVVTPELHDDAWYRALSPAIDIDREELSAACNIQRVKKSASSYLGKYLTKGVQNIQGVIDDGFEWWLPKHWWNCSRALLHRVKSKTRCVDKMAGWLYDVAELGGKDIWVWHRDVEIEMGDGHKVKMARYGRLTMPITVQILKAYQNREDLA